MPPVVSVSSLLTIQKFIFLLDDFHYKEFTNYLSSINASLPLKLAEKIRDRLPEFDSSEALCEKVYGGSDKSQKQNFNQLSSYTFKLSGILALNYPAYLHSNIPLLQKLVNEGKREETNVLAEALLDIAERVEDFQCQVMVLKFMSQQAFLVKDVTAGMKLDAQLEAAIENEKIFIHLQTKLREAEEGSAAIKDKTRLQQIEKFYEKYFNHPSAAIRIFSQYAYISVVYHTNPAMFGQASFIDNINTLEKELQNYPHLIFPFLSDIKGNFGFFKLNSPLLNLNSKEWEEGYEEMTRHYNAMKFWNSYLSFWQLHLIAIQVTRLLSNYHHKIHLSDYQKIISQNDKRWVRSLIEKCDELMNKKIFNIGDDYEMRTLKMLYGALLIIAGGGNIKKGVEELESLLIAYQQVNMKSSTDSIYLCLMIGYFAMKDYDKCAKTFRRYTKVIKDKPVFKGNEMKIYAYYYLSQWLSTKSKQYAAKMNQLIKNYSDTNPKTVQELVDQYEMPMN